MTIQISPLPITALPTTAGGFGRDDHDLTSGDHVVVEINDHLLEGRVEFDWGSPRYGVWIGPAALPFRAGPRARRIAK